MGKVTFDLSKFLADDEAVTKIQFQYYFSDDTTQNLPSLLNDISKLGRDEICNYFETIQSNELPDLQNEYFKLRKQIAPTVLGYLVCYFVFEGSFNDFYAGIRNTFGNNFNVTLLMNEVNEKVTSNASMYHH